jgi:hypothetical protein
MSKGVNVIVTNLYGYGSLTTDIINSLYNAMYLIQTNQTRSLIMFQMNRAINLLHAL